MRNMWPVVAMVLGALASVTALAVLKVDNTGVMAFISGAIIPTVTILITSHRVETRVDDVAKNVNGRMSQLIDKKTLPSDGE